jgi:lipopolysaccharide/colanic/teichoic acid biosynthesis glycosyltransferase
MPVRSSCGIYNSFFKHLIDLMSALIGLLLLLPLFLLITLLLSVANNGHPFFTQTRPGKNARLFKVIKFKTMNDKRDLDCNLLSDGERMTGIGKFIRKTSLDELPQLWNVIKGDMSLVGPRPLLVQYLPLYSTEQKRRHLVKPGITGWAQVNGRNAISWEEKFRLDVWYVDHCSFSLDMKILWLTILKVFKREGINQAGQATVEKFNGYN